MSQCWPIQFIGIPLSLYLHSFETWLCLNIVIMASLDLHMIRPPKCNPMHSVPHSRNVPGHMLRSIASHVMTAGSVIPYYIEPIIGWSWYWLSSHFIIYMLLGYWFQVLFFFKVICLQLPTTICCAYNNTIITISYWYVKQACFLHLLCV